MLKRVGDREFPGKTEVFIKEASFPVPFQPGLEFNSPAHGNWNIVHTGMLVPEAQQIYVCADNCMRGVVLTAAEMNAADRFSFVIVEEKDLLGGNLEDVTIEGVTDVLNRLDKKPKAVLLFTVCLHHFLGSDLDRIYGELEKRFPEIFFMRCFMDPIMQKTGPTPDQKLRLAMYDAVPEREADPRCVTVLGSDFALDEGADICRLLKKNGIRLRETPACETWEDYQKLGEGSLILNCYPAGKFGTEKQARRLGRPFLYLPGSFDYEEIQEQEEKLLGMLEQQNNRKTGEIKGLDIEKEIRECEEVLSHAHQIIGDTPIAVDYLFHPRPLGLTKLLLTHEFQVQSVFLDSISPEEKEVFFWLKENYPELKLISTVRPEMRVRTRKQPGKILAIGQKAAWFTGSRNFVNMVQGGGLWGFDGIRHTAQLMVEAFHEEKDPEDLIVRKGWGCESCI
ncbi:nitrogenase component 1 [Blautia sp. MSJ-36]|uniref:nitrogenase component 1 n=1 Tax=Blautia sp. MSJ-36 TaxID=2841530 RepID=UPI001C125323|nr:nitrogenase component 1 [Blautia sp. MSJ-36]MBU5446614.1 nitrogenase [Blautia sp. MSJ-36]